MLLSGGEKGMLAFNHEWFGTGQMAIPGFVAEPSVSQHYGECEPTE